MKGNVDYSVAEFREDLLKETQSNIADLYGDDITKGFYSIMTIILCTSLAFGKSIDSIIASIKEYFPNEVVQKLLTNKDLLEEIKEDNKENIEIQIEDIIGLIIVCTFLLQFGNSSFADKNSKRNGFW